MLLFAKLMKQGDIVFDVGGHIGYMAMYFSKLVSGNGRVVVFEPGENNLPYLRSNVSGLLNVAIKEVGVSDTDGEVSFFLEDLTGQNNSMLSNYEQLDRNIRSSGMAVSMRETRVKCIRLDNYVGEFGGSNPNFIKIDVEGVELLVLLGMAGMLDDPRHLRLMVEVTNRPEEVFGFLSIRGFSMFDKEGVEISATRLPRYNWFCVKQMDDQARAILRANRPAR